MEAARYLELMRRAQWRRRSDIGQAGVGGGEGGGISGVCGAEARLDVMSVWKERYARPARAVLWGREVQRYFRAKEDIVTNSGAEEESLLGDVCSPALSEVSNAQWEGTEGQRGRGAEGGEMGGAEGCSV